MCTKTVLTGDQRHLWPTSVAYAQVLVRMHCAAMSLRGRQIQVAQCGWNADVQMLGFTITVLIKYSILFLSCCFELLLHTSLVQLGSQTCFLGQIRALENWINAHVVKNKIFTRVPLDLPPDWRQLHTPHGLLLGVLSFLSIKLTFFSCLWLCFLWPALIHVKSNLIHDSL